MNDVVREWIAKAEADFATAGRELRVRKAPNFDAACFHAKQCVEKLMKAVLIHLGAEAPKTHDLVVLDGLLRDACPGWRWHAADLRYLSRAAVAFRYPGESAERRDAAEAVRRAGPMREALLSLLHKGS